MEHAKSKSGRTKFMHEKVFGSTVLALILVWLPTNCWAWGGSGHRMISKVAVRNLPADVPSFLKNPATVDDIGEIGREPDRSRGSGVPHDPDLDPAHFVDVADDVTVGGIALTALPPKREDFAAMLRQNGTDDYKMGYLPYAIQEGWQQLVKDFAYWRVDVAAQKFASSPSDAAWFARDQHLREMLTIRDLGFWSHFVGDASQPMHVSVHYDGWGNFPNPSGYPERHGLHAKFESDFVSANVRESDIEPLMGSYSPLSGTIRDWTVTYLSTSQAKVIPLYELAKLHPFDGADATEKAFTIERLAAGARELRDLTAAAWYASERAKFGNFAQMSVEDAEQGKISTQALLSALRGSD
jgi:S1/P1 Nuclease